MPLFNESIVTKGLGNIIDIFFGKIYEINKGIIDLNNSIVPQLLLQNARRYSVTIAKRFFQFKIISV